MIDVRYLIAFIPGQKLMLSLVHHDNRDFGVIPNYQPLGQPTFNEQTQMLGPAPGVCSYSSFL